MRAGKLLVGVFYANGAYVGASNTGVDSAGRDYRILIPVGVPLKLWLFSEDVTLRDASGQSVYTPGSPIPFQASAGQDHLFTFGVTGTVAKSQ